MVEKGGLTFETKLEGLAEFQGRRSPEESQGAFAKHDKNDDGMIARKEFVGEE